MSSPGTNQAQISAGILGPSRPRPSGNRDSCAFYVLTREHERQVLARAVGDSFEVEVVAVLGRLTLQAIERPIRGRGVPGDLIATARLDCDDDACGPEYVARAKAELQAATPPVSIDFTDGVMIDVRRGIPLLVTDRIDTMPFQTLVTEIGLDDHVVTGLHMDHTRVAETVTYGG